ncbi:probable maleylacetoacetate isomerase 2 [Cherax quadricarinatus]
MSAPKPILFSYYRSSCSWRVRIALAHKGVDYEYRPVHLLKQEQVTKLASVIHRTNNPEVVICTLIQNSHRRYCSSAYSFKLERFFLPSKVREICEVIGSGIQPLQNLSVLQKVGEEKKMEWSSFFIKKGFIAALEQLLTDCAGKYSVGDEVTLADCCIVPQIYNATRFKVDMAPFPTIRRVYDALAELDPFKAAHPSNQPDCPEEMK